MLSGTIVFSQFFEVIYISSPEELTGEAREILGTISGVGIGLDFGGLFRDWLAQLALGLFDAENGLVEHSCVDGTCYARLKPGGDLKRLEAMGKVLGLALRDQQPLGDICPPLAHLLTHPTLPRALQQIREIRLPVPPNQPMLPPMDSERPNDGVPPSVSGGEELRRLGFSAEWLRYEYDFWRRAAHGAAPLDAVDYQGPRSAEGLREHMERKALSSLVLDVSTELEHLWRGLRSVPNVSLPSLEREVKRGLEDAEEERPSKRRRLERSRGEYQGLISGGPDVPVTVWQGVTRYSPVEATQALDGQRTVMWCLGHGAMSLGMAVHVDSPEGGFLCVPSGDGFVINTVQCRVMKDKDGKPVVTPRAWMSFEFLSKGLFLVDLGSCEGTVSKKTEPPGKCISWAEANAMK
eukprot:s1345_g16.t1